MPSQIMGYYNSRKEKLLRDFDRTSALMKDSLVRKGVWSEKGSELLIINHSVPLNS